MIFKEITNPELKSEACNRILRSIPKWFGIETAIVDYSNDVKSMRTWGAYSEDRIVGFAAINKHSNQTAEVHVMGFEESFHGKGWGTKLLRHIETEISRDGFKYLTVKTLSESRPNKEYDLTRKFYLKYGFTPIEEFKTLWNEDNPCLMLIKNIDPNAATNNWTPPVLKTERLTMRALVDTDVHDIFAYCSNPNVAKYVTWDAHKTIADSYALIERAKNNYKKKMPEPYGIVYNDTDKIIGTVGCFVFSENSKIVEIAYALDEKYWGQGLIKEACEKVIEWAFEMGYNRIQARCETENTQSSIVMQKLGMKFEGTLRESYLAKNRFRDLDMYSLLRKEWNPNV